MKPRCCILGLAMLVAFTLEGQETTLFKSGDLGYACFRIPALAAWGPEESSAQGPNRPRTLFAFAEGRRQNCGDFGDVEILMRKSSDGGQTWSVPRIFVDNGPLQAGNATPIFDAFHPDAPKGRLFLFYNTGTASEYDTRMGLGRRRGFYIFTDDQGEHWSDPVEISAQTHWDVHSEHPEKDARTWAFAPGHGMQFAIGPYRGRLYVPANHSMGPPQENFKEYRSYGLYSDDHGITWKVAEDVPVPSSNEAMAVQIGTEDLLLLIRMQNQGPARKLLAESHDGGQTRDSTWLAQDLATPMCQSSILHQGNKLYHCGPADTAPRSRLLLQKSENFGQSWEPVETIWMGSAAYCDVVAVAPDIMGVFYERQGYSEMVWTQIVLDP